MLLRQLRPIIDDTWDKCWPVSSLRPLAVLDLFSYLFFVKKTGEENLINGALPALTHLFSDNINLNELTWEALKKMDVLSMHYTFTKKNGVMDLMKYYAKANLRYSNFFKAPLLITPSSILLSNAVALLKIMEEVPDENTQSLIIEHLVNKSTITSQEGQVYIPEDISRLMVSLLQPSLNETIQDPAVGNASLLINSAVYIRNKFFQEGSQNHIDTGWLTGFEADLVQLRIAAMNLTLHNIHDAPLKIASDKSQVYATLSKPGIILSNLFFTGVESQTKQDNGVNADNRREVFLLREILKNLQPGTRVAVLVPDIILSSDRPEITTLREELILQSNLEAVISLSAASNPLFYGAAILVFNKNKSATQDVWFASITKDNNAQQIPGTGFNTFINPLNIPLESDTFIVLYRWNKIHNRPAITNANSFFIPADTIKQNNFNFVFNNYRQLSNNHDFFVKADNPVIITEDKIEAPVKSGDNMPVQTDQELLVEKDVPGVKERFVTELPLSEDKDSFYTKNLSEASPSKWKKQLVYTLLAISVIANVFLFLYFKNKRSDIADKSLSNIVTNASNAGAINNIPPVDIPVTKNSETEIIKPKPIQNKATADTMHTSVINKLPVANYAAKQLPTKGDGNLKAKTLPQNIDESPVEPSNTNTGETANNNRYAVISKAYIYKKPSDKSIIITYITSLDNGELVTSKEKNGFVYAIFYDSDGSRANGWLNMKDLKLVE